MKEKITKLIESSNYDIGVYIYTPEKVLFS